MSKYLLKFEKKGVLRYTSHLDLLRLFKRTFKRAGVELEYTRGFNPRPKMGFAQPLSLGYSSVGEYLEFETTRPYNKDQLIGLMNSYLPFGLKVLNCKDTSGAKKSAASTVSSASYEVSLPKEHEIPTLEQIDTYLKQERIVALKATKKRSEYTEVDIKPMIIELEIVKDKNNAISMKIHAGSSSNLNPELLLSSLFSYCKLPLEKGIPDIIRVELFNDYDKPLI
jgi:radical SAM-linked protein